MTEHKTRIKTVEPELEPEYVGAYNETESHQCQNWVGEYVEDVAQCKNDATHTIVMRSPNGSLHEIASCDSCGEPDDV